MPAIAYLTIRDTPVYRRDAFAEGLKAAGFAVRNGYTLRPNPGDILVTWNRYGSNDIAAAAFERAGSKVLVAENGYLGRDWIGSNWYALSLSQHNGAGQWRPGGPERWRSFRYHMRPWRSGGKEIVMLPQRGIGPPGVAMPQDFPARAQAALRSLGLPQARIRAHPGEAHAVPLLEDLKDAALVVTWGSGAALKALLHGVPVVHGFPKWIGATPGMQLDEWKGDLLQSDAERERIFSSLAWAMWAVDEIAGGEPIARLL